MTSFRGPQCPRTPGRKRRRTDASELSPARRCRLKSPPREDKSNECQDPVKETIPSSKILLSSPSDVSNPSVLRSKQATASGLPDLSRSPVGSTSNPGALTEVKKQQKALKPPLSRRRFLGRRPRVGAGIVRWRTEICVKNGWDEETDTDESEDPADSPEREESADRKCDGPRTTAINSQGCGCCNDCKNEVDAKPLEESIGSAVLPIDPNLSCFNYDDTEDLWQLRSPSPDGAITPITSTEMVSVRQTQNDDTKTQLGTQLPEDIQKKHQDVFESITR